MQDGDLSFRVKFSSFKDFKCGRTYTDSAFGSDYMQL